MFVVSAVEGVEVQTEMLWRRGRRPAAAADGVRQQGGQGPRRLPRRCSTSCSAVLGHGFAPLELPLGEAATLHGVVDVLTEEALEYERRRRAPQRAAVPADVADQEHQLHDEIVEEIVSGDDEQLERYLSGDVPPAAELERALAHEVLDCTEFPVLLGSALTGVGVDRLADFICELGPSPADRPVTVSAGEGTVAGHAPTRRREPLAYVFKTIADPFVGQLSVFKVLSGRIGADDQLLNSTQRRRPSGCTACSCCAARSRRR